jgi:hypothetical protein
VSLDLKEPMHKSRVFVGSLIHVRGAIAPLIIGEVVMDPEKRWRFIRISAAVTAVAAG